MAVQLGSRLRDTRGRMLRDMRISVTDRCNFRCVYCMPKEIFGRDYDFMPHAMLLSFEEIVRVAQAGAAHGVHKLRLTGGEPLLRKDIEKLVAMLAELRTTEGEPLDIALTTNGSALAHKAQELRDAGLKRVTISLDSLDEATFRAMNDIDFPLARVLDGIRVADEVGFDAIKVNTVVKRGANEDDVLAIAEHFRGTGVTVRFIEFMDVGTTNGWNLDQVVPSAEIIHRISAVHPLEQVPPAYPGETASRWRYADGAGEIGAISSVTEPFCGNCTRARISADGKLFTCLFASKGHDLRALLRAGCTDAELEDALGGIWGARDDRYSELRSADTPTERIEMSYIGG
ncbi:cyclic pyranopterin phosphate synthase [Microbacterium sp. W4I4]|uniref:GTP 3',8-cyclase MoaA n=1 Tax=Microbacterium sp. W4I4 TaxID=3042295 RepID=UPI002781AFFA|nr:GTP 3',8-cyclase MoaA [Microbacterium sp. W4I4]MDQ0615663.1 cyclic pyranopterin phosphate synthase [Microbacterium sp. W4I4]